MTDWEGIVRQNAAATFRTAWRILGHVADTEDVVQEVLLEAYQMHRGRQVRCWEAVLRKLAVWRALDRLRGRRRASDRTIDLDCLSLPSHGGGPEQAAMQQELQLGLREAVARLPHQQATAFCLRYFEDLSPRAIAGVLGITPGAVSATLHKARLRLACVLGRHAREAGVVDPGQGPAPGPRLT
jgi:RNA polymerase sigma-70 factor (ECF subfamily)